MTDFFTFLVDKTLYDQKVNELKELEITIAAIDSEIQMLQNKKAEFSQKIAELKHQRVSNHNEQERFLDSRYWSPFHYTLL